ncbi:MAG: GspF: general secretion pathway protein F [candidate division CPR1 bacterium GW2011_GWC1_49_13]|uniref:GspF: general secretion pathway protein F n=1 Tax=candidate division CPR1 bacterium GW2011_GWC1_49_13 TaxID=1618342 RepID=A0A0G1VGW2_9BACT|nr:MAG: GspF: general secretion pathway protein F [candidate division CPR1 bacterium GW2011_GWC1_49_13]
MAIIGGVSFSEKFFFTKNLTVMLKSGIPISQVVDTLAIQAKSGAFKKILFQVSKDVTRGQSLEKSLRSYPNVFNQFYVSLIKVGEESGTLEDSLVYLVEQMEKEHELREKVRSAMLYPSIVLMATGGIGLSLAFFILPQIIGLFESLNVELPFTTIILIWVAKFLRDWGLIALPGMLALFIGLFFLVRSRWVKPAWHAFLLRLPTLGTLLQNISLATLTRNLGIMLKSGLTITSALETSAQVEENLVYQRDLMKISEEVRRGKSIETALTEGKYKEFPLFMVRMVGVGEKSGNLEENLAYLGDYFEDEVDTTTRNLATILEPVLLIGIGAVVAFVALSIISPIYSITGSIR